MPLFSNKILFFLCFFSLFLGVGKSCFAQTLEEIRADLRILENQYSTERAQKLYEKIEKTALKKTSQVFFEITENILLLARKNEDLAGQTQGLLTLAQLFRYEEKIERAEKRAFEALQIAEKNGLKLLEADALHFIGGCKEVKADYDWSLEYEIKAAAAYEALGNQKGMALCYRNMASTYKVQKDYDLSIRFYDKCLLIAQELKDEELMGGILNGLGTVYERKKDFPKALSFFKKSLLQKQSNPDERRLITTLNNMGDVYLEYEKYDSALYYYNKSLELAYKLKQYRRQGANLLDKARLYKRIGEYEKAIELAGQSLKIQEKSRAKDIIEDTYLLFYEVYLAKKDYEKSLFYYKAYTDLKDSILNERSLERINELKTQYETAEKEEKIEELESEALQQKVYTGVSALVAALSLLLIFLLYKQFALYKKLSTERQLFYEMEKEKRMVEQRHAQIVTEQLETEKKWEQEKNVRLEIELDLKNKELVWANKELELRDRELVSMAMQMAKKNELLNGLEQKLNTFENQKDLSTTETIRNVKKEIKKHIQKEDDWDNFLFHFEKVHSNFFIELQNRYTDLTPKDLKMCAYLRLNLSTKEIADLLNQSSRGVETSRYRLRKKLDLDNDTNLTDFLSRF